MVQFVVTAVVCGAVVGTGRSSPNEFHVKVRMDIQQPQSSNPSMCSGGFDAESGEYGRIAFSVWNNGGSFDIAAVGTKQYPVLRLLRSDSDSAQQRRPDLFGDLYLKVIPVAGKTVMLKGYFASQRRTPNDIGQALAYAEKPLNLTMSLGTPQTLPVDLPESVKGSITVTVSSKDTLLVPLPAVQSVTFKCKYSLFAEKPDSALCQDRGCTLAFALGDPPGSGACGWRRFFSSQAGPSVLFFARQEVSNVRQVDSANLSFDLTVSHGYLINPPDSTISFEDLREGQVHQTVYSRTITARSGEATEVRVPIEANSPLPIRGYERFVMTNELKTIVR